MGIFFCYARKDQQLLDSLKVHLTSLLQANLINMWHNADISPGTAWEEEINKHLNTADLILLLLSPDFIASEYCYGKEMTQAMERHDRGEARVIPVIFRPVIWQDVLGKLQALPTDAIPVMSSGWHYQDEAFLNVTEGIRTVAVKVMSSLPPSSQALPIEPSKPKPTETAANVLKKQTSKPEPLVTPEDFSWQCIRTLTGHKNSVNSVAISADGQTLASGSSDNTIQLWNLKTGNLLHTLTGHESAVLSVAISADGQTLASGSRDETIMLWKKK